MGSLRLDGFILRDHAVTSIYYVAHRVNPPALGGIGANEELAEVGVEILLAELRIVLSPLLRRTDVLVREVARLEPDTAAVLFP